ncbi:hypothetical protein WJX74_000067 [Apatococcus lobatus]|uniref:Uncharacterized protein n=1 Tax=Apatococcus lobatus TaxID=904363 RepID=A0AAW1Q6P0_9CHLO
MIQPSNVATIDLKRHISGSDLKKHLPRCPANKVRRSVDLRAAKNSSETQCASSRPPVERRRLSLTSTVRANMQSSGTGFGGPGAKAGDISAPTGGLPAGATDTGLTAQSNARPSPKDLFKMHNASGPSNPQALANRPVNQDPISEADHVAPTHGGHMGQPGNMSTSSPDQRTEGVDAYAKHAHGDHLAHGVNAGTGYAGGAAASGNNTAPTGSLPPGTIEAGAQNQNIPRPSAKDQFLMNNSAAPSNPKSLADRMFKGHLGIGKPPGDSSS